MNVGEKAIHSRHSKRETGLDSVNKNGLLRYLTFINLLYYKFSFLFCSLP